MESEDWVYLQHEEHGGIWRAPAGVAKEMENAGWFPTDERPVEPNPATAEMPREWFDPVPEPAPKKSRRVKKSTEDTDASEDAPAEEGSETVG